MSVRGGQDLSQGEAAEGFDQLDEFGVIREIEKPTNGLKRSATCTLERFGKSGAPKAAARNGAAARFGQRALR
jgi:hypothetical protein